MAWLLVEKDLLRVTYWRCHTLAADEVSKTRVVSVAVAKCHKTLEACQVPRRRGIGGRHYWLMWLAVVRVVWWPCEGGAGEHGCRCESERVTHLGSVCWCERYSGSHLSHQGRAPFCSSMCKGTGRHHSAVNQAQTASCRNFVELAL